MYTWTVIVELCQPQQVRELELTADCGIEEDQQNKAEREVCFAALAKQKSK
jgi:hypothetical protein